MGLMPCCIQPVHSVSEAVAACCRSGSREARNTASTVPVAGCGAVRHAFADIEPTNKDGVVRVQ